MLRSSLIAYSYDIVKKLIQFFTHFIDVGVTSGLKKCKFNHPAELVVISIADDYAVLFNLLYDFVKKTPPKVVLHCNLSNYGL